MLWYAEVGSRNTSYTHFSYKTAHFEKQSLFFRGSGSWKNRFKKKKSLFKIVKKILLFKKAKKCVVSYKKMGVQSRFTPLSGPRPPFFGLLQKCCIPTNTNKQTFELLYRSY